jgi:hypothetical protein
MFYFEEKQNLQWSKLGPRAMFGKFMLDIAKKEKKIANHISRFGKILRS